MTEEQQRIAIAEAHLGYKDFDWLVWCDEELVPRWEGRRLHGATGNSEWEKVPDYLNDLNAVHEAVMTLTMKKRSEFRNQLQYLIAPSTRPNLKVSGIKVMGSDHYDEWFNAPARQRAEAFLRTLNLWIE